MSNVDSALQSQVRNIEATYGRKLDEWFETIDQSGLTKHNEVVAMLKSDYGLAHGAAHRVSLLHRERGAQSSADPVSTLFSGNKAGLRPIFDAIIGHAHSFQGVCSIVPKKGYLSLVRRRQFAMVKPSTTTRVDLGFILKGVKPTKRLEDASGFNALFTHRVRLSSVDEFDAQVRRWLARAWEAAG